MPSNKRSIIAARNTLAGDVAATFLRLEANAHATATQAALCMVSLLEGHRAAGLPPAAGQEAIDLISEAARLATLSRSNIVRAHELLRDLPRQLKIPSATGPECPPNEGEGRVFSLPFGQAA